MRVRKACCCCGSTLPDKAEVPGSLSGSVSSDELQRGWIGIGSSPLFAYFKCVNCGTLNVREYPLEADISNLYASMPPNMAEVVDPVNQSRNQAAYAQTVAHYVAHSSPTRMNVLELGADCGLFCRALQQRMPEQLACMLAVEPNMEVHHELLAAFHELNIDGRVHTTVEEALGQAPDPVNLVVGIHVFDHIFDLDSLFIVLRASLSPHGYIFFVVHNPSSAVAKLLGKRWPPYCAQHPQLFTRKGIAQLAIRHSLKLIRTSRTRNHFPLEMVAKYIGITLPAALRSTSVTAPLGNRCYLLQAV